jgi:hypothetical protein
MKDIREADWKVFREVHGAALERFFERAVREMERNMAAGEGKGNWRERFWEVLEPAQKRRKEAAELFDDFRRSTALIFLARLRREGLVTDEEMGRFSEETRKYVAGILSLGDE